MGFPETRDRDGFLKKKGLKKEREDGIFSFSLFFVRPAFWSSGVVEIKPLLNFEIWTPTTPPSRGFA